MGVYFDFTHVQMKARFSFGITAIRTTHPQPHRNRDTA